MSMLPFSKFFPELAERECRTVIASLDELARRPFAFVECYCVERGCDCRRVLMNVVDVERGEHVATINHAFEPPRRAFGGRRPEPRTFLDPINPQSALSRPLLALFEWLVDADPGYHQRLIRHYTMWKEIVDDPDHPAQAGLEELRLGLGPVSAGPSRRTEQKIGRNAPCPCGSGRKHKRCCGGQRQAEGGP